MKKKAWVIVILLILILLIGTEIFLRLTWGKSYGYSSTPLIFQSDPILGYTYIPNSRFYKAGKMYKVNNQGYIGNDFTPKKQGVFRIAFVGTCIFSGYLDYNAYSNCCTTIQDLFTQNHWNVEVLNCGVDGNSRTFEIFKSIEYKIVKFNPDLIICENLLPFESNNLTREIYKEYILDYDKDSPLLKAKYISMIEKFYKYKLLFKLIDHIYILKFLCVYYTDYESDVSKISEEAFINLQKNRKDYFAQMLELYIRKKRHYSGYELNTKKYAVSKSTERTKELIEKLKKQNTSFYYFKFSNDSKLTNIDGLPFILLNQNFEKSMFDGGHLNQRGNELFGRSLFNIIIDNRLIPIDYLNK